MPWLPSQADFQKAVMYWVLTFGMPSETVCGIDPLCLASRIPFLWRRPELGLGLHHCMFLHPSPHGVVMLGLLRDVSAWLLSPLLVLPQHRWAMREMLCKVSAFGFLTQASSLCPQHHQIIQQYMVTLENLLFTAELDPHILAVFQQFCALQA